MEGLEGIIYLAIIAFMFGGGFGGFGFGNNAAAVGMATQNDVQRGFDNIGLQDQSRDILTAVNSGTAQAVAAANQAKYDNINVIKDAQMYLSNQISDVRTIEQNIMAQQSECCCNIKQLIQTTAAETNANIAQSKYDISMQLSGTEQRIMSKLDQNKIESLQAQVQQLQLQQAMCGVVRYPMAATWNSGPYPPATTTTG